MYDRHLILVGSNYQPQRSTGDKNFWVELIPLLAKGLQRIAILSVKYNQREYEEYKINGCYITIRYYRPRFLETPDAEYRRPRIFWRKGVFPRHLGVIEKFLNGKRLIKEIKDIFKRTPFQQIHLMDNFGLVNRIFAKSFLIPVSVSAMSYQKNHFLYDFYLCDCYRHPNLTVVPYSLSYYNKLLNLGVKKIFHIPWGVIPPENFPSVEERKRIRTSLGLPADSPLFLWAGYIQQVQKKDFLIAYRIAKEALNKGIKGLFYFAFKPEAFEKAFSTLHKPENRIYVKSTDIKKFNLLRSAADVFYSPVFNQNCIIAPPLTWIESLSLGIPILTTDVAGASEIICNAKTGYMSNSSEELLEKMFIIAKNYQNMIPYCVKKVSASYNIKNVAKQYLSLWFPDK